MSTSTAAAIVPTTAVHSCGPRTVTLVLGITSPSAAARTRFHSIYTTGTYVALPLRAGSSKSAESEGGGGGWRWATRLVRLQRRGLERREDRLQESAMESMPESLRLKCTHDPQCPSLRFI